MNIQSGSDVLFYMGKIRASKICQCGLKAFKFESCAALFMSFVWSFNDPRKDSSVWMWDVDGVSGEQADSQGCRSRMKMILVGPTSNPSMLGDQKPSQTKSF